MTARRLTAGEWAELSPGLAVALAAANADPLIEDRPHLGARLARLRFGHTPILALGRTVWWPQAASDFSGTTEMAVLQHELQHVLEFAEGALSPLGYLISPRNWTYRWTLTDPLDWSRLGAEQRASVAEALWHAERDPDAAPTRSILRGAIPWARGA